MENVKNLVSKKFRPYFQKWLDELSGFGYRSFWRVLDAKDYGVPQHRERVFCVSVLDGGDGCGFAFPEPFPLTSCLGDVLEDGVDEKYYLTERALAYFKRSSDDESHNHTFTAKKTRHRLHGEVHGGQQG